MTKVFSMVVLGLLLAGCNTDRTSPAGTDSDNTAVNARDADDASVTPMDQSNEAGDIDQVATIRQAVLDLDDLSTNGRNVKIITEDGKVVLRGPVASAAEKDAIGRVAIRYAGPGNVANELEVEAD